MANVPIACLSSKEGPYGEYNLLFGSNDGGQFTSSSRTKHDLWTTEPRKSSEGRSSGQPHATPPTLVSSRNSSSSRLRSSSPSAGGPPPNKGITSTDMFLFDEALARLHVVQAEAERRSTISHMYFRKFFKTLHRQLRDDSAAAAKGDDAWTFPFPGGERSGDLVDVLERKHPGKESSDDGKAFQFGASPAEAMSYDTKIRDDIIEEAIRTIEHAYTMHRDAGRADFIRELENKFKLYCGQLDKKYDDVLTQCDVVATSAAREATTNVMVEVRRLGTHVDEHEIVIADLSSQIKQGLELHAKAMERADAAMSMSESVMRQVESAGAVRRTASGISAKSATASTVHHGPTSGGSVRVVPPLSDLSKLLHLRQPSTAVRNLLVEVAWLLEFPDVETMKVNSRDAERRLYLFSATVLDPDDALPRLNAFFNSTTYYSLVQSCPEAGHLYDWVRDVIIRLNTQCMTEMRAVFRQQQLAARVPSPVPEQLLMYGTVSSQQQSPRGFGAPVVDLYSPYAPTAMKPLGPEADVPPSALMTPEIMNDGECCSCGHAIPQHLQRNYNNQQHGRGSRPKS